MPYRLPVDAGRLHRDVSASLGRQPVRQRQQFRGGCLEGTHFAPDRTIDHVPYASHDRVLMNIKAGTMWIENFHRVSSRSVGVEPRTKKSNKRAPQPLPTAGDNLGCSGARVRLEDGLVRTIVKPTSVPTTLQSNPGSPRFHPLWVGNAGGRLERNYPPQAVIASSRRRRSNLERGGHRRSEIASLRSQ